MNGGGREKPRLDQLLVDRGLVESRAKAQALVMAGKVFSGETKLEKPGSRVKPDIELEVRGAPHPWVSRGGLKLAHGIEHFAMDFTDAVVIDVGSSTGGFTDVALANGARRVYAVDVGKGQLAWKLRTDDRVVLLEGVNARTLTDAEIPEPADIIVCDASFIGLEVVLPAALALARPGARLLALIKPQFEVGKSRVGKGGIVRDQALRDEVVMRIRDWLATVMGWEVIGVTESPITGADGNVEYLIAAVKT
jgi:23S rRNA (cytidine1920-2'-O)/16S rRNA (cytidine1409-2'-O)-methyltransferase